MEEEEEIMLEVDTIDPNKITIEESHNIDQAGQDNKWLIELNLDHFLSDIEIW